MILGMLFTDHYPLCLRALRSRAASLTDVAGRTAHRVHQARVDIHSDMGIFMPKWYCLPFLLECISGEKLQQGRLDSPP